MPSKEKVLELKNIAQKLRQHIIEMICQAASGHPGGSLSAADIVAVLYFHQLKHNPKDPKWVDRDRFVMSKGHAAPVLYAALAESGYFPLKYLTTLRQIGSSLQGHIDMLSLPGIEMSTGSLGQGLSAANGMALAGRLDNKDYQVYCLLGDGECQEGQVWEAAMTSAHYKLDKITAIIDHNKYQIDGSVEKIKNLKPFGDKWKSFGWNVISCDGHDVKAVCEALEEGKNYKGKPSVIIADTIKGKGVVFMEEKPLDYHGKAPTETEKEVALKALCQIILDKDENK
ncbi:transketolase [candidate division WOR-1 bacterium RIFOXYB2_FULL_42_35]|uniref:Transketolase n=1 Tax=candidate division WOR-1 bacterium RIFOXYC2_FULL_41_25 TaxID=1802586 RepID=A0A1F4TPU2_UNCSA|nr:MAG: transketolase [candidate division WOR-1 bacterium RIFOXYA2_FULL_41_14]OGC24476.1 MAG: transketolase [candidate division WOR-1 bacterium RIFOXYB2_FULL_42_35]OGC34093.1 MAG: transketolase [candidate division WOR-1 bacterium RIFOXYC2_FULL_41_25]OGC43083.1 MAG: transketolase [candidate division WOR-1 bacterium RIFOXYD2_FULL_41_8]